MWGAFPGGTTAPGFGAGVCAEIATENKRIALALRTESLGRLKVTPFNSIRNYRFRLVRSNTWKLKIFRMNGEVLILLVLEDFCEHGVGVFLRRPQRTLIGDSPVIARLMSEEDDLLPVGGGSKGVRSMRVPVHLLVRPDHPADVVFLRQVDMGG